VREGAWSQVSVVCVRVCGSQVWPEEEEEQLERELHQSRVRKGKIPPGLPLVASLLYAKRRLTCEGNERE
jgi:hypothetical protein